MITLPEVVRNKALATGAADWIDGIDALVGSVAHRWGLVLGAPFGDGSEAYVTAVTRHDGTPAVLKLLVPRADAVAQHEITVLRLAGGAGCARLLEADETIGAMLLERLGPSLHDLALPYLQRQEILTACAAKVWRPAPGSGLPTGAEKGRWLVEYISSNWEALGRPCTEKAVDHALACARRRIAAHDDERAVLVHGDVHEWNALLAGDGFKLVDPDGLLAEAEYDLGVLMREDPLELIVGDPYDRANWLAARCGLDARAIWEWGVVERVSTGLTCVSIGLEPIGRQMLDAADHVAHHAR